MSSDLEARARVILGLDDLEAVPNALPIRVERMWRKENFAPVIPYTGSLVISMGHAPDLGVWQEAVAAVARRHEVLHSHLGLINDRAVLLPSTTQSADLAVVKVSRSDIENHHHRPSALSEFFGTPMNLFQEPGFRCRAFRDEDDNVSLGILMHHYVGDAWSTQILRREIKAAHAALADGTAPDFQPAPQYSDYALSQRRALAKNLPAQLDYWQRQLAAARPTELPFDRSGDPDRQGRAFFFLPAEILEKLTALSRAERISLSIISLAAFQRALAIWCGQTHAVTAVTSADRIAPRFRDTVGRLIAGVPVASDFSMDMPVREFLTALARQFYDTIPHWDLAFEQYDEIFSPAPPFCPTRFNFIPHQAEFATGGDGASRPEFSGVLRLTDTGRGEGYSDMLFILMQYPDGLLGRVTHSLNFSPQKIEAFIAIFSRILEKIVSNPGGKLSELL
jgi:hypothetical protein